MSEPGTTYQQLLNLPPPNEARQKILQNFALIVPPSPFVVPVGWEWTHTAPFEGPSVIASVVKGMGFGFKLIDQREDFNTENIREKINGFDYIVFLTKNASLRFVRKKILMH
jgi:hypothetical protein